jgi:hypothetical protein
MKPIASLSLDLDNKWSYMKTHGDAGWDKYPTYLDLVVPRFLKVLHERDLRMTVFVVGQDAAREENYEALASISAAGHEIGNHSFNHEPWLHLYSEQELVSELAKTEEHLERVTGQCPIGFRGPGFSFCDLLLKIRHRVYPGGVDLSSTCHNGACPEVSKNLVLQRDSVGQLSF